MGSTLRYLANILCQILGKLTLSANEKAAALMDGIVDFSKTYQTPSLSCVRVVIRQKDTLATFVEEMHKASKTEITLEKMITTPLRYFGNY